MWFRVPLVATLALLLPVSAFKCPPNTKPNPSKGEVYGAVWDFATRFYYQKDLNSAFNNFVAADYIQHNPDLGDGRQTAIDGLKSLWADPKTSFAIHRIFFGEDGFVVQSEASFAGGPRTVVYDIFALQGTCITEHWDNMQAIKSNTVSQHPYF